MLNQDWFAKEWRKAGHQVITLGFDPWMDIRIEPNILNFSDVLSMLPPGFRPEIIVFHDNSMPLHYFGFDQLEVPLVFYSVDAHHHIEFHKHFGNLADYNLVAQHDYVQQFNEAGAAASWLPLWATHYMEPQLEKRHGAIFVGSLNPKFNPERVEFFNKLQSICPIECLSGAFWNYFPYAEIVMNQSVRGDLNFRMFQGMASGAMMLTDRPGNGFDKLFVENEHLVVYQRGNAEHAAELIGKFLEDKPQARKIGKQGRELILERHTTEIRAKEMLSHLEKVKKKEGTIPHLSKAACYIVSAVKMEKVGSSAAPRCLIEGMIGIEAGLKSGEKINAELANYIVIACCRYDALFATTTGNEVLQSCFEAFPDLGMLALGVVRNHLNRGERVKAMEIASRFAVDDVTKVFEAAEDAVRQLLNPALKQEFGRLGIP